ncbi:MAG: hypothetical protein CFE46_10870 [Burkholderiales bacterium PBB6]|nr:MAG: hypothetical protein CFE46_10870 [Burkholderiales bacterium PBB6]
MRCFALWLIRLYQRWLSPYKGFSCAYRVHLGQPSCSELGWRAIRRHGPWKGTGVLRLRMHRCGVAHRRFQPEKLHSATPAARRMPAAQRGDCDLPCDGCDLPGSGHGQGGCKPSSVCDCADMASCCDWPSSKKKSETRARDRSTRLPQRRTPAR